MARVPRFLTLFLMGVTLFAHDVYNCKTTYGATGNGTTDDTTAIQNCINAVPSSGGEAFLAPGKYLISSTLTLGNGSDSAESTKFGIKLTGAGSGSAGNVSVNTSAIAGATEIIWGGTSGGTMIRIAGPTINMGVLGIHLEGNTSAGTGLEVIHAQDTVLTDILVTQWTSLAYSFKTRNATSSLVVYGNCGLLLTKVGARRPSNSTANGMKFDGYATSGGFDTCSVVYIDGDLEYGGGSSSSGLELAFTDSNMFKHVSFAARGGGTGGASIKFTQQGFATNFPYGNTFDQIYWDQMPAGTSGVGGNFFLNLPVSELSTTSIPYMTNIHGLTDTGLMFGPMTAVYSASADSDPTFHVQNINQTSNSAGNITFKWGNGSPRSWVRANYFDGLLFGTANGGNAVADRWRVEAVGNFVPVSSNTYDIGASGTAVRNLYMSGAIYSGGAAGLTQSVSVRRGDNSASCTITVAGGIITSTTC